LDLRLFGLAIVFMVPPLNPDFTKILRRRAICITGRLYCRLTRRLGGGRSLLRNYVVFWNPAFKTDFKIYATEQGFAPFKSNPKEPRFAFIDRFAYSLRADFAMRGSAISILTRACVAFRSSFLAFFLGMLP